MACNRIRFACSLLIEHLVGVGVPHSRHIRLCANLGAIDSVRELRCERIRHVVSVALDVNAESADRVNVAIDDAFGRLLARRLRRWRAVVLAINQHLVGVRFYILPSPICVYRISPNSAHTSILVHTDRDALAHISYDTSHVHLYRNTNYASLTMPIPPHHSTRISLYPPHLA